MIKSQRHHCPIGQLIRDHAELITYSGNELPRIFLPTNFRQLLCEHPDNVLAKEVYYLVFRYNSTQQYKEDCKIGNEPKNYLKLWYGSREQFLQEVETKYFYNIEIA